MDRQSKLARDSGIELCPAAARRAEIQDIGRI